MLEFGPNTSAWCLMSVQIVGLASAWLARIGEGSKHQHSCQWLFFACLGMVAAAMLAELVSGPARCLATGATLSIMVLATTWDFSAGKQHIAS